MFESNVISYGEAICPFCKTKFTKMSPRQKVCKSDHYTPCPDCGKLVKITDRSYAMFLKNGPKRCKECANKLISLKASQRTEFDKQKILEKRKHTNLQRFGTEFATQNEEIKQKQVATFQNKYGVNRPLQSEEIKQSMISHNVEKYGVKSPQQSKEVYDKYKANLRKKYGVDNISQLQSTKDKIKQTSLTRYGVDHPMKSKEIQAKCSSSIYENYGVYWPMQSENIRAKQRQSYIDRLGVDHPMKSEEIKHKVKTTIKDRYNANSILEVPGALDKYHATLKAHYGVYWPMESDDIKIKSKNTLQQKYEVQYPRQTLSSIQAQILDPSKAEKYKLFREYPKQFIDETFDHIPTVYEICNEIGCTDTPVYDILIKNHCQDLVKRKYSRMEHEVVEFIQSICLNIEIKTNDRTMISPYELDVYIPQYSFAIECNPTVTHNSSFPDPWNQPPKSPSYHKMKTDLCEQKNITLFHIFGYEWAHKKDIIQSMLKNRLGKCNTVYGRNTYVCELSYTECSIFLNNNHRQGSISSPIRLGLRKESDNELVSVMTFGKIRNSIGSSKSVDNDNCYELSRFCNRQNISVIGGASKLFKYFLRKYLPMKVISFSDRAHTSGMLYQILGFKQISRSDPGYIWVNLKTDIAVNRLNTQKRNLKSFFNDDTIDVDQKTERQIMEEMGYVRVFDSGIIRWEYTK